MMPYGLMGKAFIGQYCCDAASLALHTVAGTIHSLFTSHPIGLKGFTGNTLVPEHVSRVWGLWMECNILSISCSAPHLLPLIPLHTVQISHIFQHPKRCKCWKGIFSGLPSVKTLALESDAQDSGQTYILEGELKKKCIEDKQLFLHFTDNFLKDLMALWVPWQVVFGMQRCLGGWFVYLGPSIHMHARTLVSQQNISFQWDDRWHFFSFEKLFSVVT